MKKIFLFSSILLLKISVAQNTDNPKKSAINKDMIDKQWKFCAIVENNKRETIDTTYKAMIKFDNENTYFGFGGCNSFYGAYWLKNENELNMKYEETSSSTYCGEEMRNKIEKKFTDALSKNKKFSITQDTLNIFFGENGKMVFFNGSKKK